MTRALLYTNDQKNIFLSSNSLFLLDHLHELLKADVRIVGTGGSLWMVLDAHGFLAGTKNSSTGAVIQVDVRHFDI